MCECANVIQQTATISTELKRTQTLTLKTTLSNDVITLQTLQSGHTLFNRNAVGLAITLKSAATSHCLVETKALLTLSTQLNTRHLCGMKRA